jgi:hypothetical protein
MRTRAPQDLQVPFDRITYREGQLLAARDLEDDFLTNQRLRRLHVHYLHNTWGISLGYAVSGNAGDDTVHIGPGYAIDISAREIVLSQDIGVPVPNTAVRTDLMLVVNYQDDSAYRALPDLRNLCMPGVVDPMDERPGFAWRTPDTLRPGLDVPLAHAAVSEGALIAPLDLSVRRNAARLVRPHVGFDVAEVRPQGNSVPSFLELPIDTTDYGFSQVPQYFARLVQSPGGVTEQQAAVATAIGFISDATPSGFVYNVPRTSLPRGDSPSVLVAWLGLEPITGCAPVFNPIFFFMLDGRLSPRTSERAL